MEMYLSIPLCCMGALLLLSMMAMPLAEAQHAPNGASMFRSVLDPQLEFGPTDLQQVRRHMITRGFQTMRIYSTGCTCIPGNSGRVRIAPVKHVSVDDDARFAFLSDT